MDRGEGDRVFIPPVFYRFGNTWEVFRWVGSTDLKPEGRKCDEYIRCVAFCTCFLGYLPSLQLMGD